MNKEIISLTSIRGVAALWVLFYHFLIPINRDVACISCYFPILEKSYLAVDLFFVLSGYILTLVYHEKIFDSQGTLNRSSVLLFLKARLLRIYPLHLFTLLVLVSWVGFMNSSFPDYLILSRNNIETFIYNIFLIQSWGVWGDASWNNPSWSISAEFFAYLIFPFSMAFLIKFYRKNMAIILIIIFILLIIFRGLYDANSFGFGDGEALFRCSVEFFYGVLGFVLTKKSKFRVIFFLEKNFIQFAILIMLLSLITLSNYDSLVILLYLPLIISISHDNGIISSFLKYKPLHYLGLISYSIYLNHAVVLYVYRGIRVYYFDAPSSLGLVNELIIFLGLFVCTLCISHLTYIFIENCLRNKLR